MGVVLYELCNLQHAFQGEVRLFTVGSIQDKAFMSKLPTSLKFYSTGRLGDSQSLAAAVKENANQRLQIILYSLPMVISK